MLNFPVEAPDHVQNPEKDKAQAGREAYAQGAGRAQKRPSMGSCGGGAASSAASGL